MSNNTYNGWANYATWRVNMEMFDGMLDSRYPDEYEWMKDADSLKDYAEQTIEETSEKGLARDYAMAFLSDVNWYEIANHYNERENDNATNQQTEDYLD